MEHYKDGSFHKDIVTQKFLHQFKPIQVSSAALTRPPGWEASLPRLPGPPRRTTEADTPTDSAKWREARSGKPRRNASRKAIWTSMVSLGAWDPWGVTIICTLVRIHDLAQLQAQQPSLLRGWVGGEGYPDHHRGHHPCGLRVGLPGHSGQAQDRRPVGHQGPGGGSRGPGARRVRPLLQMGLPEDPASVEFLCQHSSCVIMNKTLKSFSKIVSTFQSSIFLQVVLKNCLYYQKCNILGILKNSKQCLHDDRHRNFEK